MGLWFLDIGNGVLYDEYHLLLAIFAVLILFTHYNKLLSADWQFEKHVRIKFLSDTVSSPHQFSRDSSDDML